MSEIVFEPPPRRFVDADVDGQDWAQLEPLFAALEERPLRTVEELEEWLVDISELDSVLDGTAARLYIQTSCHTDDEEAMESYMAFQRDVVPEAQKALDRLDRRYLSSPLRQELDPRRYEQFDRIKTCDAELFREENLSLQTRDIELSQRYSQIVGGMTIEIDGEQVPLPRASLELEKSDRDHREKIWRLTVERRQQDREEIEEIFEQMLELRQARARNADLDNFRDYRFRSFHRFDYGVAECEAYAEGIREAVVPVLAEIDARRAKRLGLDTLRPWDFEVNPFSSEPIRPFSTEQELIDLARTIFGEVDPRFAAEFTALEKGGMLDLFSRNNKAPGGYQYFIEDTRIPFIFANAAGKHEDLQILLHEGGHAFHSLASREEPLILNRSASLEFCEVASMGFEFFGLEHIDRIYTPAQAAQARVAHLEKVLRLLAWIATVDAFQHWIYTTSDTSREGRHAEWVRLRSLYGSTDSWEGLEEAQKTQWHRQGHIFKQPFYYIEYGIAMLGSLQLWCHYREDRAETVRKYREALALGGTRSLAELFEVAGLEFEFGVGLQAPLVERVREELDRLEAELG